MTDTAKLRAGDFEALEAPLTVAIPGVAAPVALVVEAVKALPPHRYRDAPFSVILRGPREPVVAQSIQLITHPALGEIELFLVPIGQDPTSTRYELTFN